MKKFLLCMLFAAFGGAVFAADKYWTGAGGKGMNIAVLQPTGMLDKDEQYLAVLVQGTILADFNKFSDMTVIDRQNLDKRLAEIDYQESGLTTKEGAVKLGRELNARYIVAGSLTKAGGVYMLELAVTDVETGVRLASFVPRRCTAGELLSLSIINNAAEDLLAQLGVKLTDAGKKALHGAEQNVVQAEVALSKGIAAQRIGNDVDASFNYNLAAAFNPKLLEALSRASITKAEISSGNIGDDVRNDIKWRKDWVARLEEVEKYFNENSFLSTFSPHCVLLYDTKLKDGAVNYKTETVPIGFAVELNIDNWYIAEQWRKAVEETINTVNKGLIATGRKQAWGFGNWPQKNVFSKNYQRKVSVSAELLNDKNKVIGKGALNFNISWGFNFENSYADSYRERFNYSCSFNKGDIIFNSVKANDITDALTIRFATVNGMPVESESAEKLVTITDRDKYGFDISGYNKEGYNRDGYDASGHDKKGHTQFDNSRFRWTLGLGGILNRGECFKDLKSISNKSETGLVINLSLNIGFEFVPIRWMYFEVNAFSSNDVVSAKEKSGFDSDFYFLWTGGFDFGGGLSFNHLAKSGFFFNLELGGGESLIYQKKWQAAPYASVKVDFNFIRIACNIRFIDEWLVATTNEQELKAYYVTKEHAIVPSIYAGIVFH